jgi:hypothetical protein
MVSLTRMDSAVCNVAVVVKDGPQVALEVGTVGTTFFV